MFYIIVFILCFNDTMIFVIVQTEDNLAGKQNDRQSFVKVLLCSLLLHWMVEYISVYLHSLYKLYILKYFHCKIKLKPKH